MVQSPVGSLLLSSWCAQNFICALQDWSLCFPQSSGSPIIKSHWPLRPDSPGIPSPFVGLQAGKPDMGLRTFTTVGELLRYYCSPVCGSPNKWVWHLIFIMIEPFLSGCLAAASSLSLDMGYLFFVGFQCPPVDGCSTTSCNFDALSGGDERTPFYSTIFNWTLESRFLTTGP